MTFTPQRLERACIVVAWLLCGALAILLALRVSFPWDVFHWAESPFMTDMMKLGRGQSLYSDPSDSNSYVYSPGLSYLCHAILSPFRKHLDIRYCRLVVVLIGLGAVAALIGVARQVSEQVSQQPQSRGRWLLLIPLVLLVVFKNMTSETTHPDNLHLLHLSVTGLLGIFALRRQSFALAVWTVCVASVGVWAKQTAVLAALGAATGLSLAGTWGRPRAALLFTLALLLTVVQVGLLLGPDFSRYYLLDVLAGQCIQWYKAIESLQPPLALHALLLFLLPFATLHWWRHQGRSPALILWFVLGACEVSPAMLSYCKINGAWNNLGVIDVWLFVLVVPFVLHRRTEESSVEMPADPLVRWFRPITLGLLLITLIPTRLPPTTSQYVYCDNLGQHVGADLRAGKRVLVPCGTMSLIHNRVREVPLDRGHTFLELNLSGNANQTGTLERVQSGYYDRIYMNCDWYGYDVLVALEKNYRKVGVLAPPESQPAGLLFGDQGFLCPVNIYERRDVAEGYGEEQR